MKGLIIPPNKTELFTHHSVLGYDEQLQDMLFSILLNDKAYVFEHTVQDEMEDVIGLYKREGVLEFIPETDVQAEVEKTCTFSHLYGISTMDNQLDLEEEFFVSLDDNDVSSSEEELSEQEKASIEREYRQEKYHDLRGLFLEQSIALKPMILSYMDDVIVDEGLYQEFCEFGGPNQMLDYVSNSIGGYRQVDGDKFQNPFDAALLHLDDFYEGIVADYPDEMRYQQNGFDLVGKPENDALDRLPSKQEISTFLRLLESRSLLKAALNFSNRERVRVGTVNAHNYQHADRVESPKVLDTENYSAILSLLLEGTTFPNIDNLESFLRLRDDKNFGKFKQKMNLWSDALESGELKDLEKIREEIIKANDAITIVEARKNAKWIYFWTLSMYAASVAGSITAIPFPLIVNGYFLADNYRLEKKYDWLSVGY